MNAAPAMSAAESTLADLVQRARMAGALLGGATFVAARQLGIADDALARLLLIVGALAVAAVAHEVPRRAGAHDRAATAGAAADVAVAAIAVASLWPLWPVAPALMLLPVFSVGVVGGARAVVLTAVVATALVLLIALRDPAVGSSAAALSWGGVFVIAALLHGAIVHRFRDAQRTTESAFAHAATFSETRSAGDVAEQLMNALDEIAGTRASAATVLTIDVAANAATIALHRGEGQPPASLSIEEAEALTRLAGGAGVWIATGVTRGAELTPLVDDARFAYVLPLVHRTRMVGLVVAGAARPTRLSAEAQRGLARVASQAAAAIDRMHAADIAEAQRERMLTLLDSRAVGREPVAIAAWATRLAREITGADAAAFVTNEPRSVVTDGAWQPRSTQTGSALADAVVRRRLPLMPDADDEDARGGSFAAVPVHGTSAALVVHHGAPARFSSGDVQLLVMLADQCTLLLGARPLTRSAA